MGPSGPAPFKPLGTFSGQMYERSVLTHQDLADIIAEMNEKDLAEFIKVLSERLSTGILMLTLIDPGPKKITIIKIIRDATGLKLVDAKKMVDVAMTGPVAVMAADAQTIRTVASRLRAEGATVTVS